MGLNSASLRLWLLPTLLLPLVLSCQQGSGAGPATPALPQTQAGPPEALHIAPGGGQLLMGGTHLRIDDATGSAEATPVRLNQAIGDAYLVGLNELGALCNCFSVTGVRRTPITGGSRITLDVAFKHPFPLLSRPDLYGWDLKAIIATDRGAVNFAGASATASTGLVVNPTGYTEEWNEQIAASLPGLTSTLFPYVILGEDRTATSPFDFQNPAGWNVFPSGGTNTGELQFDLQTGETVDVDLFFTVGYQASATRATRQTPDYQPPRGNSRAPWRLDAAVISNDLSVAIGSTAQVDLAIWDWQHGQTMGSDVTGLTVYAPSLFATPLNPAIAGGTGRDTDPLTASFTAINNLGTAVAGTHYALVEARDVLHMNNPGGSLGTPGVTKVEDDFTTIATLDLVRTWQVVPLEVGGNLPGVDPVAQLVSTPPVSGGTLTVVVDLAANLDASSSFDPDAPLSPEGDVVDWQWDFEWDGTPSNFVADLTGQAITPHTWTTEGATTLGLRVVDGVGRSNTLAVPVNVIDSTLVLTLDPIQDLTTVPNDREEWGAALTEETDGEIVITYIPEYLVSATQRTSPGYRSIYTGGGLWSNGTVVNNVPSTGVSSPNVPPDWGYYLKAATNWGGNNTLYCIFSTDHTTHQTPSTAGDFGLGYANPFSGAQCAAFPGNVDYSNEVAISRVDGGIFSFEDDGGTIGARRGGPSTNDWCVPASNWVGTLSRVLVDSRPSHVSRSRSALSDTAGRIFMAYRSINGDRLSVARDVAGTNMAWSISDLAIDVAGTFGDPALDADEGAGVYVAVNRALGGGSFQLQVHKSLDNGATYEPVINVGDPLTATATDLSISARTIAGFPVICVGYVSGTIYYLRWSRDGGANWEQVQLSDSSSLNYSADLLLDRQTGDLYTVWSGFDGSFRSNVMARHGLFAVN